MFPNNILVVAAGSTVVILPGDGWVLAAFLEPCRFTACVFCYQSSRYQYNICDVSIVI